MNNSIARRIFFFSLTLLAVRSLSAQKVPCQGLPEFGKLKSALTAPVKEGDMGNGGLGNQEWEAGGGAPAAGSPRRRRRIPPTHSAVLILLFLPPTYPPVPSPAAASTVSPLPRHQTRKPSMPVSLTISVR